MLLVTVVLTVVVLFAGAVGAAADSVLLVLQNANSCWGK